MEEEIRKLLAELKNRQPWDYAYLSEYEQGCAEGRQDAIDRLEEILNAKN